MSTGNRPIAPGPKRGEVFKLNFRDTGGNVLSCLHWAVVVQTSAMSRSLTTMVVPISTNAASAELEERTGVLAAAKLAALDRALAFVLDLG